MMPFLGNVSGVHPAKWCRIVGDQRLKILVELRSLDQQIETGESQNKLRNVGLF